jgi:hypothetical protein
MSLTKRDGYEKKVSLSEAHSLWSGSVMLCVSGNYLYRIEGSKLIQICKIAGSPSYVEIDGLIYISSDFFTGIYNIATRTISDWGVSLPYIPGVAIDSGNMPPGRYCLCYTKIQADGQISGSGPITEIEWSGDYAGIKLLNRADDYLVWITDTNGTDLFLATVESEIITEAHYNKPLPSLSCNVPPCMSFITYAFGRMWGLVDNTLYYSEPNSYGWWKESNSFPFTEKLNMLAPIQSGIYVSSEKTTWMLIGTDPNAMTLSVVGDGAVNGTLTYYNNIPAWMSERGFVVGAGEFPLNYLTEDKLDIPNGITGASISRNVFGQSQILMSMPCSSDCAEAQAFNIGKIFIPGPLKITGSSGIKIT